MLKSDPDRRQFLSLAGGTVLILGTSFSNRPTRGSAESRDALRAARAEMDRLGLHGVALAIPSDRKERAAFSNGLEKLWTLPYGAPLLPLLVEAIYVCVEPETLPFPEGKNAVLLAPKSGDIVASTHLRLADQKTWEADLRALLHNPDRRKRLVDAATTPEIRDDLARIEDGWDPEAWARLTAAGRAAIPAALERADRESLGEEIKGRFRGLAEAERERLLHDPKLELPFGTEWKVEAAPQPEPCPPCGMALPQPPSRTFLRFRP